MRKNPPSVKAEWRNESNVHTSREFVFIGIGCFIQWDPENVGLVISSECLRVLNHQELSLNFLENLMYISVWWGLDNISLGNCILHRIAWHLPVTWILGVPHELVIEPGCSHEDFVFIPKPWVFHLLFFKKSYHTTFVDSNIFSITANIVFPQN